MEEVTIITGGAGGMGLATAQILGQNSVLVLSDMREERLGDAVATLAKAGIKSTSFVGDVTDRDSVRRLMAFAKKAGRIMSMVHTAGVSPLMGDPEFIMRINALGTIHVTEEFLENAEEGSSLVNVASMAGHLIPKLLVPTKGYGYALTDQERFLKKMLRRVNLMPKAQRSGMSYSISKRFVIWYAKEMAKAFGARRKRIVSVSPGTFDTEMGQLEEKSGAYKIAELSALGRVGRVAEIAEVLAFCAGDKASYLTGVDILCDGGTVSSVPLRELARIQ